MMNTRPLSLALVGIGGYGNHYVNAILDHGVDPTFDLVGAIDPNPSACRRLDELKARGVPLYPSLDAFYETNRADLVALATPIALHAPHTTLACARGSHVLCEKPLCATLEDAAAMRDARDRFGRHVAVGYQWSFSPAVQALKADVLAGVFGRARRLRTIVLWPRDESYYGRNRWAGAQRDAHGNFVWDSPVNNACAHYLHHMLYVIGPRVDRSADVVSVVAELYRAHPIENYDTAALRITTADDAELLFVVSHATGVRVDPTYTFEFEHGTVEFAGSTIIARMNDGTVKDYGSPNEVSRHKLFRTMDAIRRGEDSVCGIEAAAAHARCAVAAQGSMPQIVPFPREIVRVSGEVGRRATVVEGLDEVLRRCYAERRLPSELHIPWAKPGRAVAPQPWPEPRAIRSARVQPVH